ncbi:MAG: DNA recombination protein RmuC [Oligoflexales bacterium]
MTGVSWLLGTLSLLLVASVAGVAIVLRKWIGAREDARVLAERLRNVESDHNQVEIRCKELEGNLKHAEQLIASLNTQIALQGAEATNQENLLKEKAEYLQNMQVQFADTFKALSSEALAGSNQAFLQLAKATLDKYQAGAKTDLEEKKNAIEHILVPIKESLAKVDEKIGEMEKQRVGAYRGLEEHLKGLREAQTELRSETASLAFALKSPISRGRWGEIQLRRVVEMAGMLKHCDFHEQKGWEDDSGKKLRPDMVVNLPDNRFIVVDAKAPLNRYMEALQCVDEKKRFELMEGHAAQVKKHIQLLSQKTYWDQFEGSPEFVVLFLPGENFFSAALEHDSGLIEVGADHKVLLATPITLLSILRSAAYGWRQQALTENAAQICKVGKELYGRIADFSGHMSDLGKSLSHTLGAYNKAVGTMQSRLIVSARRLEELKAEDVKKPLREATEIDTPVRPMLEIEGALD